MDFVDLVEWFRNHLDIIAVVLIFLLIIITFLLIFSCIPIGKSVCISADRNEIAAFGTMLAVVVALFIAFLPKLSEYRNRPLLTVECYKRRPYCREAYIAEEKTKSYWVSLIIRNNGRNIAKKCEVRLEHIKYLGIYPDKAVDIDPIVLHWVGTPRINPKLNIYHSEKIDIYRRSYAVLSVVFTKANDPKNLCIAAVDRAIPRGIPFDIPKRDYAFFITIYSENADPVEKVLYLYDFGKKYNSFKLNLTEVRYLNKEHTKFFMLNPK